jgi:O-antigen biosynthesis protein
MPQEPAVSVIICTCNRERPLADCIESVRRSVFHDFEIVVVDNAAGPSRAAEVAEQFGARYVAEKRRGLGHARNAGIGAARGAIVAFLDDDAMADPHWLGAIITEFSDESVGAVTGPAHSSSEQGRYVGTTRRVFSRSDPHWVELACFGGVGRGTNMAFRRELFEAGMRFEPRTGRGTPIGGYEEHFAFYQVLQRGWKIFYNPDAVVIHESAYIPPARRTIQWAHAGAFATLLIIETRGRWPVLKYLFEAVTGRPRPWFDQRRPVRGSRSRVWEMALGTLGGIAIYVSATSRRFLRPKRGEATPRHSRERK